MLRGMKNEVTVLVVEDYDDTREMIRTLLEMKGCRVIEAADGERAVELAVQIKPGLILMDLNLPVLDGYEATRLIRAQPTTCDIPILAFSAQCNNGRRQRAFEAGCLECIQKPLDFDVIDELINRYFPEG